MKRREWLNRMPLLASGGMLLGGAASGADVPVAAEPAMRRAVYDVRAFGAVADGKTNNAAAIQKAIDACAQGGGGVVWLENGVYLSGGLKLKSHVELHLTSTATLLGSKAVADYNHDRNFKQGDGIRSFINAEGCEQIAITGSGRIDGQGQLFTADKGYAVRPYLVYLRRSRDIRLTNITLHNSAVWACWLLQCERVKVEGVRIDNPLSPNRDGIDLDGCREVLIANCNFKTEDDSIAFKASEPGFPCRDIVVTNCLISSKCAAIRFGPDAAADIENVSVSNCVIRDTVLNGIKIQEAMGAAMRNLVFSNIVMENVRGPISIRCAGWQLEPNQSAPFEINDRDWEKGRVQNILFENIQGTMPKDNIAMSITGTTKTRPRQITFSNIDFTFAGGGTAAQGARRAVPDLDRAYPEMYIFGELPAYGLYLHHASGIVLNNVTFRLLAEDLCPALVGDDVEDLELAGVKLAGSKQGEAVVRLQETRQAFLHGCRALNETGAFLRVEGAASRDILLTGNQLNLCRAVFETTDDVAKDTVAQR